MSANHPTATLRDLVRPISRPENVAAQQTYRLLGARWYAKGLYLKETKLGSEIQAKTLYRVEQGDFVYNRLFAWKGSFAIASAAVHGCHVSNEFLCFGIIDQQRVLPDYLHAYFSRESTWDEVKTLSTGSTPTSRNRLKESRFLGLRLPLPSPDEQKRFVSLIAELSRLQEEQDRLAAKVSQLRGCVLERIYIAGEAQCPLQNV
jgi:type I restriction enzyme S subunit